MEDFFRSLGSIIQTTAPVLESLLEVSGADQNPEIASTVNIIRKVGATAQAVVSHAKQIEEIPVDEKTEIAFNAETIRAAEAITKCGFSIYKQISSSNPGNQTTDDMESVKELENLATSIFSNFEKTLKNSPPNPNAETADGLEIVSRFATNTQSVVSTIEGILEDIKIPEDEPVMKALSGFKSSISEVEGNLEKVIVEDQSDEEALNLTEVLPVRTLVDSLTHYSNGDHQRGNKVLISAARDSFIMGAGAMSFQFFGETGAAVAGAISSIVFDGMHTQAEGNKDGPQGVWKLTKSSKPEDIQEAIKTVLSDGLIGYTGGKFSEKSHRSSEIESFERVKQYRTNLGLEKTKGKMEVWTEVKDLKTGKTYYGTNITTRRKANLAELKDPVDNKYVRDYPIEDKLPIKRDAQTCAEIHAFHRMLEDQPDADVTNTQVHTFNLRKDGQYKNMTRCDNCMTRDHHMGRVPTDKASSGILVDENTPDHMPSEFYEYCIVPPTWYCAEHSILTGIEYNKRIRNAISVFRQLKKNDL